jgi:TonB family protein
MFSLINSGIAKRQAACLSASLTLHFVFLAWFLHSPAPIFVAPSGVRKGDNGRALTKIYFGGDTGVSQDNPMPRLTLPQPSKAAKGHRLTPLPPKMNLGNELTASVHPNELAGGSAYGSLSYGRLSGPEVRPALPIVSPDPIAGQDLAGLMGDVIVEVTIDEVGNVVDMRLLQGIDPAVNQKVMAVLKRWHFAPATRDGTPIPSKQDVYYHFPR